MKLEQAGLWVMNPHFYWFAGVDDVPWGKSDPADGRWAHSPVRWDRIAAAALPLSDALRLGHWRGYDPSDDIAEIDVPFDVSQLSIEERETVVSLFTPASAMAANPWDIKLDDGRHRAWGIWSAEPSVILPVRSLLSVAHNAFLVAGGEGTREGYGVEARTGLEQTAPQILDRSERWVDAMRRISKG